MKGKLFVLLAGILMSLSLYGCGLEQYDDTKIADVDFAIVAEQDIPEQIMDIIQENKTENFRKTYTDGEFLYIIICYGDQPTTGYSIAVEDLYEAENAIFVSCMLKGPSKTEEVLDTISNPYLVLKIHYTDKAVIFK